MTADHTTTAAEFFAAVDYLVAHRLSTMTASAAKRGKNPDFPFVPIVIDTRDGRTYNPAKGLAFAYRENAVSVAQDTIDESAIRHYSIATAGGHRAARERVGLPRELTDIVGLTVINEWDGGTHTWRADR